MIGSGPSPSAAQEMPNVRPSVFQEDGTLNTRFLSQLADYVSNGFYLRLEGITLWDKLCAKVFKTSANEDVLIGPDGWLFYSDGIRDMTGWEQLTDREIWCAARSLALMQEYADSLGASFFFTVPCGKYTLYPEHAPRLVKVKEGSNRVRLEKELRAQKVQYIDLYEPFSQSGEELYWQWDSHWHSRGAALAADTILAAAGWNSDYFAGPFTAEKTHKGDLYEMLYPVGTELEVDYQYNPGFSFSYLTPFHSADDISIETTNPEGRGSLLMFRDSSGRNLYPYMAQSFEHAFFSRQNNYRMDYIEKYDSHVVIVELAERTLPYLLEYPAVFPSPERDPAVLKTVETVESTLQAEKPGQTMDGYYKVTGTLPDTADEGPVYVEAGESIYEAIPNQGSFTLWLPEEVLWQEASVYAGV